MKKKIAFIVQRYGLEVNGGAEYHCRILAERLIHLYDITILTSCAKNYVSWANEYASGETVINDIKVRRFEVTHERNWKRFHSIDRELRNKKIYQKVLSFLNLTTAFNRLISENRKARDHNEWIESQGPHLPDLINYLENHHHDFGALIFFTYLYYPTIKGIKIAPEKSILIPTAHDERQIYYPWFKALFNFPRVILYNTSSEKRFVNRLFNNEWVYSDIVGIGVDPPVVNELPTARQILGSSAEYLIYIGRIDVAKGCKILFDYFLNYKDSTPSDLKLVLVGEAFVSVPHHADIITMGFLDEHTKNALLKSAKALVMPSFYESLSMVTLESMALGIPVIVNGKCEVLKDHVYNSKAGFIFDDSESFKAAIDNISDPKTDLAALSSNAKRYVGENYSWDITITKVRKAINYLSGY